MRLSEHPLSVEWLRQFDQTDVHAARFALDSLKLVSFSQFEASIIRTVGSIVEDLKGKIAVFTIDKKIIDSSSKPGSEDRLGHTLTGLTRVFPDRLLIKPTDDQMAVEKVSNVILVDDFVASGSRILDFWHAWNPKRLKSWISFGYCKLWLTGYAIHRKGRAAALEIFGLEEDRIVFDVILEHDRNFWPPSLIEFLERNAIRTYHRPFTANFGGIQGPIVFQHGCPDNAPAVFCRSGPGFLPLFPNRSIPTPLYPCFDGYTDRYRTSELLWNSGQPTLALQTLEVLSDERNTFQSEILGILGLLAKGLSSRKLISVMTLSAHTISDRLESCQNLGLLDSRNEVTPFGYDLLARARGKYLSSNAPAVESDPNAIFYVPKYFSGEFCGVQ